MSVVAQTARAPAGALGIGQLALWLPWRRGTFEHVAVERDVLLEVLRDVFFWEDRRDGTLWLTIDAFVRMDVELLRPLVDAVDWADVDACTILGIDARFSNDVRHILEK
jgi:hypothetical protein